MTDYENKENKSSMSGEYLPVHLPKTTNYDLEHRFFIVLKGLNFLKSNLARYSNTKLGEQIQACILRITVIS